MALALVGSFELLMMLIRTGRGTWVGPSLDLRTSLRHCWSRTHR
jgi:hypothetical protein